MRILSIIQDIISKVSDRTGRTQRQFLVIYKWAENLFQGTLEACTGFGKTRVGLEAIKLLRRDVKDRKVIVVVPTIPLQMQWVKLLQANRMHEHTEVWVINSLSSETRLHHCSLLVCDEIHRYGAETFSEVFNVVRYNYILGLTATIERSDGKHALLERYAPVVDRIPLHVARQKGWVANHTVINYGISLSEEGQQEYDQLYGKNSRLNTYMALFEYDLQTIIQCSFGNRPRLDTTTNRYFDPHPVRIARKMGWRGNNPFQARTIERDNQSRPRGQKINKWGDNTDHIYHPDRIVGYAVRARQLISERKQFISNHFLKTQAVIELYNLFKRKTICFTETREAANEIKNLIGDKAVAYYSQMPAVMVKVTKSKTYKRRASVDKYVEKHPDIQFDLKEENGNFTISWQEEKRMGEKFQKQEALRKLSDNRYKIDFISSVRALNEGIDIPDLGLAIIHTRNSISRDTVQRIGRVVRLFTYKDGSEKEPVIVNIYLKNTKDEAWLQKAMKDVVGALWVDDIEDIMAALEPFRMVS